MATSMRGILVKKFGGPEVCEYETNLPIPEPNDDQVKITTYISVNIYMYFYLLNLFGLKKKDSNQSSCNWRESSGHLHSIRNSQPSTKASLHAWT